MAPSFSAAARQLNDGFEYDEYAVSTFPASRGRFDSYLEPNGIAGKGIVVLDYSYDKDRYYEEQEKRSIMYSETPDRYSYRGVESYSSSNQDVPSHARINDHPKLYQNDPVRRIEETPERSRVYNGESKWEKNGDYRGKFSQSTVQENCYHDGQGRKSYLNKPSTMKYGKEYGLDDTYQSSNRHSIQPGFQRILYDARFESKPKNNPTMIEVSPGEHLRLRGADETWRAIHNDFYIPCACICCEVTLFCIQDAVFVLCPQCLIVSPLEGVVFDGYDGGVGMGFTMENLAIWQEEIKMQGNQGDSQLV